MPKYILPPPPAREAALPQPRPALQDASDRINMSPVKLAPIRSGQGGPSKGHSAEFHKQALALLDAGKLDFSEQDKALKRLESAYNRASAASKARPQATAPAKPTSTAGKKRKAGSETSLAEDIATYKQDLGHIEVDNLYVDMSCTAVRTRINQVLDGGIMRKGEFCNAIGSSNRSLNTFLQRRGDDGFNTEAYPNAWAWFKQRELAGLKMPDVKKRQKAEAAAAAAAASGASGAGPAAKKSKTAAASDTLPDISQVHLDGEETDSVPVFDSCDEIRKKISAHLKTPGLTQAQFGRDLFAQLHVPTYKSIQSKQFSDFRGKKGPLQGCASAVFYAAYVYFEKIRIAKGKPKSKHRLGMERAHGRGGMPRDRDGRTSYWVLPHGRISMDEYGCVRISR